jgi:putative tryptophan/tyrosine transport system substrate-binding protein
MTGTGDPVGAGFVTSLARPGGNITGLSLMMTELPGKRLKLLKEAMPQSTRVAVLANPAFPFSQLYVNNLTMAAHALGLSLHVAEVHSADELDPAFAAISREGADALKVLSDPALLDNLLGRVVDLATTRRLPAMYNWKMYVEAGGLMSYGPSLSDSHRRAATYVDKILKGANPADLPVEQPTQFELVINLKTAQALSLTIPPSIFLQANEVIR